MNNLFEYKNKVKFSGSFEGLENFLDEIWSKREKNSYYNDEFSNKIEVQPFIQFLYRTKEIKSNKYVGVIHFEGQVINLFPKVFHDSSMKYSEEQVCVIHEHVLWWLSYCRKIKFPNYQTSLGGLKSDFFEVLIYLFSKYTRELLADSLYQQYEEVNNELSFIKGRLNTNEYINENITKGRWHKLNCTYDAFVFDNKFNRIIKYVANLLLGVTSCVDNKKRLREILFILDEVSDERVSAKDCDGIKFNPMYGKFDTVRDYCSLFLSNCVSFNYKKDLKLFAFLLPMEYVFEDFIFGFIDKELKEVDAKPQAGSVHLDVGGNFALRPDLILGINDRKVIADTKYKIVYSDEKDPKKGISQSDLYQMLAYGIRFKINEIILLYPNIVNSCQEGESEFFIDDEFANKERISIKAYQLPIINKELFNCEYSGTITLNKKFERTREKLCHKLRCILQKSIDIL